MVRAPGARDAAPPGLHHGRLAVEGRPLAHDPRSRECSLTSVTSLVYVEGQALPRVEYHEPNRALLKDASSLPGA